MAGLVPRWLYWGLFLGTLGTLTNCGGVIQVPSPDLVGVIDGGDVPSGHEERAPNCASNADCDDGLFCNGPELCDPVTGECSFGSDPCSSTYLVSPK